MTLLQPFRDAGAWAMAHPALVWPILTLIITAMFKPRTPEQYAAVAKGWPRVAATLQLVAALGIDTPKLIEALSKMRTGKDDPPPPPRGPSALPIMLLVAALAFAASSSACKAGQTPRETARATVLVVGDAVKQLDATCAVVAYAKRDGGLALRCADAYDAARISLLAAEAVLDIYDGPTLSSLPCAVARAVGSMQAMVTAVRAAGGVTPPVVDDALALAPPLAGACRG